MYAISAVVSLPVSVHVISGSCGFLPVCFQKRKCDRKLSYIAKPSSSPAHIAVAVAPIGGPEYRLPVKDLRYIGDLSRKDLNHRGVSATGDWW